MNRSDVTLVDGAAVGVLRHLDRLVGRDGGCAGADRFVKSPRFSVATGAPFTFTVVPLTDARKRNVSPPERVASGTVTKLFPHVSVEGGCSTS